ncbi:MAG: triphosphoribosyl-dephospho-CoA synthetase [Planctomycetota bacterium]|nr:MAG: triphosphoribosyl-dephospho-CoA synthetase [Planctomycetota bacterium]
MAGSTEDPSGYVRWLERCVRLACQAEVLAPKPGNVAPGRPFADVSVADFLLSADVSAPHLARAGETGVGPAVLGAVKAVQDAIGANTNLGIVLLLAPLCAVAEGVPLVAGIRRVLSTLTRSDAEAVYAAIRLARPGGLGTSQRFDVRACEAPPDLLTAMRAAGDRDRVAAQYVTDFADVFRLADELASAMAAAPWAIAVRDVFLRELAAHPDTLIARKCGMAEAELVSRHAADVLQAVERGEPDAPQRLERFDRWLRSDGNRRNPGTTADLIAAALFVLLRERRIPVDLIPEGLPGESFRP